MSIVNRIYIGVLTLIILLAIVILVRMGYAYYNLPIEQRFFHPDHMLLKPGGIWGHGLGIIGTILIILGIALYMMRKRVRWMARLGLLKYWLEFHIFLCTLGPILVLFHTSFKFGGLVAVSFWSMVAVFLSGVVGRYIYIQIPRTVEGRELTLDEIEEMGGSARIGRIARMKKLFSYWHVAHFPFAIVMLIIMAVHVVVTVVLGYRWIF
jgi:hypothetical protein